MVSSQFRRIEGGLGSGLYVCACPGQCTPRRDLPQTQAPGRQAQDTGQAGPARLGPIGDRRVLAELPFVREVDFCTTNQWPPRIATQIATHRPDRIDLYWLFAPVLSPRN